MNKIISISMSSAVEQLEDVWNPTEGSTGILHMPRAGKHRSGRLFTESDATARRKKEPGTWISSAQESITQSTPHVHKQELHQAAHIIQGM